MSNSSSSLIPGPPTVRVHQALLADTAFTSMPAIQAALDMGELLLPVSSAVKIAIRGYLSYVQGAYGINDAGRYSHASDLLDELASYTTTGMRSQMTETMRSIIKAELAATTSELRRMNAKIGAVDDKVSRMEQTHMWARQEASALGRNRIRYSRLQM